MTAHHGHAPCPGCGYTGDGLARDSVAWHEGHEAQHLAAWPDADRITRDNLAAATARARLTEDP